MWPRPPSATSAGLEGFYHYRQYSAVELARTRTLEDVWYLLGHGRLPDGAELAEFSRAVGLRATSQRAWPTCSRRWPATGAPLDVLRTAVSLLGAELGWAPTHDIDQGSLSDQALRLCAVVPTILCAAHRLRQGRRPVPARPSSPSPPTTCGCSTAPSPSRRTPGRSSST